MLFTSTVFLFIFLPLVVGVYYLIRRSKTFQNLLLLFASLFFCAWGEPALVAVMLLSIAANWLFGKMICDRKDTKNAAKAVLVIAVIFNLGLLFAFRYLSPAAQGLSRLLSLDFAFPDIAVPVGISFYTLRALSYVIDVYRGKASAQKNPLYVGLYISLFPLLIAGPIVSYSSVESELRARRQTSQDFCDGSVRFMVGFIKRVLVANAAAAAANGAFDSTCSISMSLAWLGAAAYALEIYYTFSGYSDMAIGIGLILGFHFKENFDYPYSAKSVSGFFSRWQISLTEWFADYVSSPLGSSKAKSKAGFIFSLLFVWLLMGVWYGANLTFVIWGLFFFVLIALEKLLKIDEKAPDNIPVNILRHFATLLLVVIGFAVFRCGNVSEAWEYIKAMFGFGSGFFDDTFLFYLKNNAVLLVAGAVFAQPVSRLVKEKIGNRFRWADVPYAAVVAVLFVMAASCVVKGSGTLLAYFNF